MLCLVKFWPGRSSALRSSATDSTVHTHSHMHIHTCVHTHARARTHTCTCNCKVPHQGPRQLFRSWSCCGGGVLSVGHRTRTHVARCVVNPCSVYLGHSRKHAKCELCILRCSHHTDFFALHHTDFLSLAVKSRWGALARPGSLAILYDRN